MPTPLQQEFDRQIQEFDKKFACNIKHAVPNPVSCKICFLNMAFKSYLKSCQQNTIEKVREMVSKWRTSKEGRTDVDLVINLILSELNKIR